MIHTGRLIKQLRYLNTHPLIHVVGGQAVLITDTPNNSPLLDPSLSPSADAEVGGQAVLITDTPNNTIDGKTGAYVRTNDVCTY
jgi:hypothetical protein